MKKFLVFAVSFLFWCNQSLLAQGPVGQITKNYSAVVDTPTITIAGASVNSSVTPTVTASQLEVQMKFGTVTGSYGTCTAQLQTSKDDATFLTLGSAVSITVTSATVNDWVIMAAAPTTTVTSGAVSATVALVFGTSTRVAFSCMSYGTSAPVVIRTIAR